MSSLLVSCHAQGCSACFSGMTACRADVPKLDLFDYGHLRGDLLVDLRLKYLSHVFVRYCFVYSSTNRADLTVLVAC